MRRRLLVLTLVLAGATILLPSRAAAQGPTLQQAAARLRVASSAPAADRMVASHSLVALPDSVATKRKDHTVTGLLIGAGVGFVAGWAFYNTICEAENNRCSDGRGRLLLLGTATGAALGGLAGAAVD
jgi:hypothetical protein